MTQLVDLTLTLGSERVAPVPGLVGVSMEPLHTHESHARSNTKLTLATHLGHPRGRPLSLPPRRHDGREHAIKPLHGSGQCCRHDATRCRG